MSLLNLLPSCNCLILIHGLLSFRLQAVLCVLGAAGVDDAGVPGLWVVGRTSLVCLCQVCSKKN